MEVKYIRRRRDDKKPPPAGEPEPPVTRASPADPSRLSPFSRPTLIFGIDPDRVLQFLRDLWALGPSTLLGLTLLLLLLWVATGAEIVTPWFLGFMGLAVFLFLLFRSMPLLRKLSGVGIAVLGPAVLAVAIYWRTTGPGFLWSAFTAVGTVLLAGLAVFNPLIVDWLIKRRAAATLAPLPPTPAPVLGHQDDIP
jgi:hypothetical protein